MLLTFKKSKSLAFSPLNSRMTNPNLTKSSKAMALLREWLQNAEMSLSYSARTLWGSDPFFSIHKLNDFCKSSIKLKKKKNGAKEGSCDFGNLCLMTIALTFEIIFSSVSLRRLG